MNALACSNHLMSRLVRRIGEDQIVLSRDELRVAGIEPTPEGCYRAHVEQGDVVVVPAKGDPGALHPESSTVHPGATVAGLHGGYRPLLGHSVASVEVSISIPHDVVRNAGWKTTDGVRAFSEPGRLILRAQAAKKRRRRV